MWTFAGLFESSARRSKRPLPGKWPDDASDTSFSDLSLMEDGMLDDQWFDAVHNRLFSFLWVIFSTMQCLYCSFMGWIHGGPCAACGEYSFHRTHRHCAQN